MQDDNQPTVSAPAMGQPFSGDALANTPAEASAPVTPGAVATPDNPQISSHAQPSTAPVALDQPSSASAGDDNHSLQSNNGALDDLKEKALHDLTPLLDTLDQPPEEKYKTLMMVIQASDNQELLKTAYETAQKISDPKAKADALVGILNEINYFSQGK